MLPTVVLAPFSAAHSPTAALFAPLRLQQQQHPTARPSPFVSRDCVSACSVLLCCSSAPLVSASLRRPAPRPPLFRLVALLCWRHPSSSLFPFVRRPPRDRTVDSAAPRSPLIHSPMHTIAARALKSTRQAATSSATHIRRVQLNSSHADAAAAAAHASASPFVSALRAVRPSTMYRAMSGSFPFNIPGTPSAAFHSHDLRDAPLSPSASGHAAPLHTVADEEPTTPRLAPTRDDGPKVHLVKLIARGTSEQTNTGGSTRCTREQASAPQSA